MKKKINGRRIRKHERIRGSRWVWYSQSSSRQDLDLSILAAIETTVSSLVFLFVTYKFNLWTCYFTILCTAPLLLLRTKRSTSLAEKIFFFLNAGRPKFDELLASRDKETLRGMILQQNSSTIFTGGGAGVGLLLFLLYFACGVINLLEYVRMLFTSVLAKVVATCLTVLCHPLSSIGSIPYNWRRATLVIDSTKELEIIPGLMKIPLSPFLARVYGQDNLSIKGFYRALPITLVFACLLFFSCFIEGSKSSLALGIQAFAMVLAVMAFPSVLCELVIQAHFLMAIYYRLAIKGTAIIWLPVLFMANDINPAGTKVEKRLRRLQTRTFGQFLRIFAIVWGVPLALKNVMQFFWGSQMARLVYQIPIFESLRDIVALDHIALWQIASLINYLLTWVVFAFVNYAIANEWYLATIGRYRTTVILGTLRLISWVLGIYVIVCTLIIFSRLTVLWSMPTFRLLPKFYGQ